MTTIVRVLSVTRTTTAVHVAAKLVAAIGVILNELGLGALYKSYGQWEFIEKSLRTWMAASGLERVSLEVYDPAKDEALAVCRFPISYFDPDATEATFQQDLAMARYGAAKARAAMRSNAVFRLLVWTKPGATAISGWSDTTARSTDGMIKISGGTIAAGPHASASLTLLIRR